MGSHGTNSPLHLTPIQVYKARPLLGQPIYQRGKASVDKGGKITLLFPFNAGIYEAYGCTDLEVEGISNYKGGLQVHIKAGQKLLCWQHFATRFKFRPKTSPYTVYNLQSSGVVTRIYGTAGGQLSRGKDGRMAIALSEGLAEITNEAGMKAMIQAGQMAEVSKDSIKVGLAASPEFKILAGRIITHPDNLVTVNEVETRYLSPGTNRVTVTALSGETRTQVLREWPKGEWREAVAD